jgi:hypothetical protein
MEIRLGLSQTLIFPHSTPLILLFSKREKHIHDTSNMYVPFPQLFAKEKSLKSEGIGLPRDKNKGLHGDLYLSHVEPIKLQQCHGEVEFTHSAHFEVRWLPS